MLSRKKFLKNSGLALAGWSFLSSFKINAQFMSDILKEKSKFAPAELASNDAFWKSFRKYFSLSNDFLNFNHGAVNPQSIQVQRHYIKKYKYSNKGPSYFMWQKIDADRENLRENLARKLNCNTDELAINRNTTEGLNTIIFGFPLKPGDEVVVSKYDYPNMMNALKQREKRDGIVLKWIDFDFPLESVNKIVAKYEKAITNKTKFLLVPHIINWTGQLMPVKEIAKMARQKNCTIIVDGAHSFVQIDVDLKDIDCDFYATSLHKWLGAPFGTGLMYIKEQHIEKIWPLLGSETSLKNDIRKFETIGTRSFASEMAILDALNFHNSIGAEYISARFQFLKNYLFEKLERNKNIGFYTSKNEIFSAGLVSFYHKNISAIDLYTELFQNNKILTSPVIIEKLNGVRVSPHYFNTQKEIDYLAKALSKIN